MTCRAGSRGTRAQVVRPIIAATVFAASALAACAEIGTSPTEPAAIEFQPLAAPAIVLGDSLRDIDGVATPAHAIVRNVHGDVIADAPVQYIYADFARDTALSVDETTGFLRAIKTFKTGSTTGRIAARAGSSLQLIRTVEVTTRPDSMDRKGLTAIDTLKTTVPDTGRSGATANTSVPLTVVVRHIESATDVSVVRAWLVKYQLLLPTNATNDTTQGVFLVDESFRPSTVDTTDGTGQATRQVRVRAALFPATTAPDSVVVQAIVRYRGVNVKGSPFRLVLPVRKK